MGLFDDIKAKGAAYRLSEESLYAEALREIEAGQRRDGLWAKALSESDMDQSKAGAKYIKLRVISLKDEITVYMGELNRAEGQNQLPPQKVTSSAQQNWGTRLLSFLVVFAAIGAAAFYYVSMQRAAAAGEEEIVYPNAPEVTAHASPNYHSYLPMDTMVVNLADKDEQRVAQVGITLEIKDVQSLDAVRVSLPTTRTSVLELLSQRTAAELLSMEGKQKLAMDILEEVSVPFGSKANSPVVGVLFSSFIVQ